MVVVNDVASDVATNNQYLVRGIGTHDGERDVEYGPSVHVPYVLQGPNALYGHVPFLTVYAPYVHVLMYRCFLRKCKS